MEYGFDAMVYEIPGTSMAITDLGREAGINSDSINQLYTKGLRNIPVNRDDTLDVLINRAVQKLSDLIPDLSCRVSTIMFAHSLPFFAPTDFNFFESCLRNCHLDAINRFSISGQPCSILHQGVQQAVNWLNYEEGQSGVLLIGGDQAYSAEERFFFGSVMGDAVFAGLISPKPEQNKIIYSLTETELIACEGELSQEADIAEFRARNPMLIRKCIEDAVGKAGITMEDISYIVPHTPYHSIWDLMSSLLRIPREKILDEYIEDTGHFNSNDSFCHYIRACEEGKLHKGDIAVLINPGFGGSRGCTVLEV